MFIVLASLQSRPIMSLSDSEPPEGLFLDISVQRVLHDLEMPAVEPWATSYIDAIHGGRFGDAIWARYHIYGNVIDGMIEKLTVLESITEDAMGYKKFAPEEYAAAVAFYKHTMNCADKHPEVIEIILRIDEEDLSSIELSEDV
ncbi:hypothetical protein ACLX1H_009472 [Fusarium chlamydosporum]